MARFFPRYHLSTLSTIIVSAGLGRRTRCAPARGKMMSGRRCAPVAEEAWSAQTIPAAGWNGVLAAVLTMPCFCSTAGKNGMLGPSSAACARCSSSRRTPQSVPPKNRQVRCYCWVTAAAAARLHTGTAAARPQARLNGTEGEAKSVLSATWLAGAAAVAAAAAGAAAGRVLPATSSSSPHNHRFQMQRKIVLRRSKMIAWCYLRRPPLASIWRQQASRGEVAA